MLFEKGTLSNNKTEYWFELRGNILIYYERKLEDNAKGIIFTEGCQVEDYHM